MFRGGLHDLPLVSITDRAGHVVRFDYDSSGEPTRVTHSGGYEVSVAVADGRILSLALGDVTLVGYEYDETGNLSGVVNSSGRALRFRYDAAGWRRR